MEKNIISSSLELTRWCRPVGGQPSKERRGERTRQSRGSIRRERSSPGVIWECAKCQSNCYYKYRACHLLSFLTQPTISQTWRLRHEHNTSSAKSGVNILKAVMPRVAGGDVLSVSGGRKAIWAWKSRLAQYCHGLSAPYHTQAVTALTGEQNLNVSWKTTYQPNWKQRG